MSQLLDNETYSVKDLDENWIYKQFGSFNVKTLHELQVKHSDLPWITDPQLPSTAIQWYSKVVWDITTFWSRLTQSETEIDLLVVDVNSNTAQVNVNASAITQVVSDVDDNTATISVQATQIASLVSDVSWNTSSITQNATDIASAVSDIAWNYSLIQQNVSNINLKVSKDEVIAQINISPEGVYIEWDNIQLNWNTQVLWSFSVTSISDAGDLATQDNVWSSDVTFNYASSDSKWGRYNAWLTSSELTSWNNPYNWVVMDSGWIRGYGSGNKNFEIDASDWSAYFRGDISAQGWFIDWTLEFDSSNWILQSSDYAISSGFNPFTGWIIDHTWMSVGNGKGIIIAWSWSLLVWEGSEFMRMTTTGLYFNAYLWSDCWELTWGVFNNIDIIWNSFDLDSITATENFAVEKILLAKWVIVVESWIAMNGSADMYLTSSSNRIYATDSSGNNIWYIYYSSTVWKWRVNDETNWSFYLEPPA